jgi:primary-amine oxidase
MHPLEPLTGEEIAAVAAAVRADARFTADARFVFIAGDEPSKEEVAQADAGAAGARRGLAVLFDKSGCDTHRVVVGLEGTTGHLASWTTLEDVHATLLIGELFEATLAVREDQRWQEAMRRRGIENFDLVQLDPWPAGNFTGELDRSVRRVRVVSYVRHHEADNGYAHPIEGVVADVDLLTGKVLDVEDYGVVPIPQEEGNYGVGDVTLRQDLRPLEIVQPEGPSFQVDGNLLTWQKWRMRVTMHPLDGLVLHTVAYQDGDRLRSILHRAAVAEMVVPYGETSLVHRWKNAFDAGEFGLGRWPFLNSLTLGCDCLGVIHYLDAIGCDEAGNPFKVDNAICIHEEDYGILWKHQDLNSGRTEVRRSRRLVVSSIHTVGNYEYGFYWYFYLDGTIQMEVKLTGIMQTMAVPDGWQGAHATLIAPGLAAPHHQHLFNFRLDFDLDGSANSVEEVDAEYVPSELPYGNTFTAKVTPLATERAAQRLTDPARSRYWRIVNPSVRNRLGAPVAYKLVPSYTPTMLADPESSVGQRAAFATRNLWVTPFSEEERRAAGDFPNLHPGGAGLPKWTAEDRPIADTDIVVWHTFGVTHVARPEDWPVMPVEYTGFTLAPVGFFERNPSLDVPPSAAHCAADHE